MFTVGCKRVEKPESAIECEEVVEDTNMQFPYCCTRLRCLVVVQGEVWTKVLGQPWETLPTAPWSHMYKRKRPPPIDENILLKPKDQQGPIYELHNEDTEEPKKAKKNILRMKALHNPVDNSKTNTESDIVIALTSDDEEKRVKKGHISGGNKLVSQGYDSDGENDYDKEREIDENEVEKKEHPWPIPKKQWSKHEKFDEADNEAQSEKKVEGSDLQSLVDAIETRMRDIEDVVQRMNQNIVSKEPENVERRYDPDSEEKRHKTNIKDAEYLHISEDTTTNAEIGNSVFKKLYPEKDEEKEPTLTYIMAPVDNRRKSSKIEPFEKTKHKKHIHRRKGNVKKHKKHHDKMETKKHLHKHSYIESDKDFLTSEDSVETPILY